MKFDFNFRKRVAAGTLAGLVSSASASENAVTAPLQKPAWLTDCSLGVKESYDNNVFLSGADAKYLPAAYTVPPGSVAALKDEWSWLTTVSPKLGVNFAPLLGDQKMFQTLSLAYVPDFVVYHDQDSESYNAHRFLTAIKGRAEAVSFSADNNFLFVDGSDMGPVYPGALLSAFATAAARERREQISDRANFSAQIDCGRCFIRPAASLLYYDMMTDLQNVTGYQNYVDRYDVNGGVDFGYKIVSQTALTLGWRYGHQYQESFAFDPKHYSSTSDYQRVLLGVEGRPWHWLEVKIQGGPDFRNYGAAAPVNDHQPVKYFGEAQLTATLTPADTLTFKCKQWQWVSMLGKVPFYDSLCDLGYHRKLTDKLGLDLGGRLESWDYTSGNLSTCQRDDWQYTVTAGLGYNFNPHLGVNLACTLDLGRNNRDGVANPQTREFDHQLVSLGAQWKF